mmetsp:Transcript_19511/g.54427  ORF Transcript_19511/g.54427 Transcript_19511/m.54427 type:complete len:471 (+) Transcript_19511:3731-5143(+)
MFDPLSFHGCLQLQQDSSRPLSSNHVKARRGHAIRKGNILLTVPQAHAPAQASPALEISIGLPVFGSKESLVVRVDVGPERVLEAAESSPGKAESRLQHAIDVHLHVLHRLAYRFLSHQADPVRGTVPRHGRGDLGQRPCVSHHVGARDLEGSTLGRIEQANVGRQRAELHRSRVDLGKILVQKDLGKLGNLSVLVSAGRRQQPNQPVVQCRSQHEIGIPVLILFVSGHPTKQCHPERVRDFLPDKSSDRPTLRIGSSQDPVDEPPPRHGVVKCRRGTGPGRRILLGGTEHVLQDLHVGNGFRAKEKRVPRIICRVGIHDKGDPARVAHHVRHGDVVLSVGSKLRPMVGHPIVVGDQAPVHEHGHCNGFQVLSAGPDALQGVPVVAAALRSCFCCCFGRVSVEVHHLFSLFVDDQLGSQLQPLGKILLKGIADAVVLGITNDRAAGPEGTVPDLGSYSRCCDRELFVFTM